MKDFIAKGTGNSRFLKSSISSTTTWEQFRDLLRGGTAPIDLNGINPLGVTEAGTPLSKANLLSDATETKLFGDVQNRTVDDALNKLSIEKIGTVKSTINTTIDSTWLLTNGAIVSSDNYTELCTLLNSPNVSIFNLKFSFATNISLVTVKCLRFLNNEYVAVVGVSDSSTGQQAFEIYTCSTLEGFFIKRSRIESGILINQFGQFDICYGKTTAHPNGIYLLLYGNSGVGYSTTLDNPNWSKVYGITGSTGGSIAFNYAVFFKGYFVIFSTGDAKQVAYSLNCSSWTQNSMLADGNYITGFSWYDIYSSEDYIFFGDTFSNCYYLDSPTGKPIRWVWSFFSYGKIGNTHWLSDSTTTYFGDNLTVLSSKTNKITMDSVTGISFINNKYYYVTSSKASTMKIYQSDVLFSSVKIKTSVVNFNGGIIPYTLNCNPKGLYFSSIYNRSIYNLNVTDYLLPTISITGCNTFVKAKEV